jgi:hypothetical protein
MITFNGLAEVRVAIKPASVPKKQNEKSECPLGKLKVVGALPKYGIGR